MPEKYNTTLVPTDQFSQLIQELHAIASRATFTATVAPRALDRSAVYAIDEYNAIARRLRTIFEPGATTFSSASSTTQAQSPGNNTAA